jgi:hypothetical protein
MGWLEVARLAVQTVAAAPVLLSISFSYSLRDEINEPIDEVQIGFDGARKVSDELREPLRRRLIFWGQGVGMEDARVWWV